MSLTVTNVGLGVLTLAAVTASVLACGRLRGLLQAGPRVEVDAMPAGRGAGGMRLINLLVASIAVGSAGILGLRWWSSGPLSKSLLVAHVDGLLLIVTLMALIGLYIQTRPRLGGLSAFYLPVLAVMLAWAVCASAWTYRPFSLDTIHPVWKAVHLVGVYLGTLGSAVAAVAGGMYLYVERLLKAKRHPGGLLKLASLEMLERIIVQASTLGFGLLTLGLVSGVVILGDEGSLTAGWWYAPKVVLATAAWGVYAVVMNLRFATMFRGRRAAWLAIGGLVLLLVVYGIVTSGAGHEAVSAAWPAGEGGRRA